MYVILFLLPPVLWPEGEFSEKIWPKGKGEREEKKGEERSLSVSDPTKYGDRRDEEKIEIELMLRKDKMTRNAFNSMKVNVKPPVFFFLSGSEKNALLQF